jgi:DNA-binding transcriptional LysR family regulator
MELRHLRYFVLVAEELHFGRAAERAGIAQSPLSQQIKVLESELGARLFHRTNRRVSLTDAGTVLLPDARRMLRDAGLAAERVRLASSGFIGQLRVGFAGSSAFSWLPGYVRRLRQHIPGIQLTLRELTSEQQRAELREDHIDLGLTRYEPGDLGVSARRVDVEPLRVVVPAGSALATGEHPLTVRQLVEHPLVMFPRHLGPPLYDQIMRLFQQEGALPTVGQEAVQMPTIVSLVASEMGIAIVPSALEQMRMKGVVFRRLRDSDGNEPVSELFLVWRTEDRSELLSRAVNLAITGNDGVSHRS